jgi:quercetin dioxygenase-like cupin family protein
MVKSLTSGAAALALCIAAAWAAAPEIRLTPAEMEALATHAAGAGTSGVAGIVTTVLAGDPGKPGPYTIRLSVPAHTRIAPHAHRDDRAAVVVSGTWYFGYGRTATDEAKKTLPRGSFYSEPAGLAHFAETKDEPVVVYITGFGPSDTVYVNPADDPRK